MSIIQEALKKNQGMPERGDSAYQKKRSGLSLPLLVILMFATGSLYIFRNALPVRKPANPVKPPAPAVEAAPAVPKTEEKPAVPLQIPVGMPAIKPDEPTFVLSGVMLLESGPRAIINGSVVEEGDKIGGASVELIEREMVLLNYNNEKLTLRLK